MLGDLGAIAGGLSLLVLAVRSLVGGRAGVGGRRSLVAGGAAAVARHRCLAECRRIDGVLPAAAPCEAVRPLRGLPGSVRAALATQGRLQREAQPRGPAPAVRDEVVQAAEQPLGAAGLRTQALRPALRGNLSAPPLGMRSRHGTGEGLGKPPALTRKQNSPGPKGLSGGTNF